MIVLPTLDQNQPCVIFGLLSFLGSMFYDMWYLISGWVDKASAAETVDSGSIPGLVKPKTKKIGFHSCPAN